MKVVLLAGGLGTRLSEETHSIPKPMVTIGELPIMLHIMKHYSKFGFNEFVVALGYKGYVIKEYFDNYRLHTSDVRYDFANETRTFSKSKTDNWKVDLVDTGELTMTGGRLLRLKKLLDSTFMVTYGDGLSDVNINQLLQQHKSSGKLATVTAVTPPGRYGALVIEGEMVREFKEKPQGDGERINGGFFVFEPEVLDYIKSDSDSLESTALPELASEGKLGAYTHNGFWQPMDTLRERNMLEELWLHGKAPWLS
jgi:glucose-1-phosphate cytidylyltransferase